MIYCFKHLKLYVDIRTFALAKNYVKSCMGKLYCIYLIRTLVIKYTQIILNFHSTKWCCGNTTYTGSNFSQTAGLNY